MRQILLNIILLFIFIPNGFGKIVLSTVFSDNMVLQQNSEVAIWGWGMPGEKIKIVAGWNSKDTVVAVPDNNAKFQVNLKTIQAGGPYTVKLIGTSKITLKNVMLGEVWLCSGQSNMEWNVDHGITNGEQEAANATNKDIRIFHVQKIGADVPQQNCQGTWKVCSPETMRESSALGYFFAREIQEKLNVPVGIIISAWGGTPIEVWMEINSIIQNPELDKNKINWPDASRPDESGKLYNSMINPLIPYGIAGAIWYQGESNTMNSSAYASMMKTMIEGWRKDFKKDFPFYFVQIAPFDYWKDADARLLREQQEIASKTIPNTGMVVISDLVDDVKDIHPKNKQDVGIRLANYALVEIYKKEIGAYKSPMYQTMQFEKSKVRLTFSNVPTGLKSTGKTPEKFLIAGEDHNFVSATAKIDGKTILLSSKMVKNPVAVRYCFDNASLPDVFSTEGLPLAAFRTDNWDK